jgi:HSP20 family protein
VTVYLFSPARDEKDWRPAADVYRTSYGWILKFDLAGVRLEDIQVEVNKRAVIVRGVRRDYMVEEGCRHYSMEITYSHFHRKIELPDDLSTAKFRLDYRDGILFVRINVKEEGYE